MEGIKIIAVILVCVVHSLCSPIDTHASKEIIVIQEHGDQLSDGDTILDHNDEGDHGDDLNIHDIDVMPGSITHIGSPLGTARRKRNAAGNDVNIHEEDIDLSLDDDFDLSNDADVDAGQLPVRRKRNAAPLTEDQLSDDDTILDHIEKVNKGDDMNMYEEDIDISPDDGVDSNDADVDPGQLLGRRKRNVARDWKKLWVTRVIS